MKRREFIKTAGVIAGASMLSGVNGEAASNTPTTIKKKNRLGRTGLLISDISFGGGKLNSPLLMAKAVDIGVNYFDTAPDYGTSETNIGKYLARAKGRDKIYIASKFCDRGLYPTHLPWDAKEESYIKAVEASLTKMRTDYLDVVFVHAMGENHLEHEKRLLSQNMLNAFARLKKSGKARFLAVSSHGPEKLESLLMTAVKSGHYDIIMPAFNFLTFPKIPEVLKVAAHNDIGVVAMKTLAGAKDINLDPGDEPFAHAAFAWTLKHKEVAGLIVSIRNLTELYDYVKASGTTFTKKSERTLKKYRVAHDDGYCRTGCGDCVDACPSGVDVASLLRQRMYFVDYGYEKQAMKTYARMNKADCCADCTDSTCEEACSHDLPVRAMLKDAHKLLSFT